MTTKSTILYTAFSVGGLLYAWAQAPQPRPPRDAVSEAQKPSSAPANRVEQQKTVHDRSAIFSAGSAPPASTVVRQQPKQGRISGFDFYRDPLNADKPGQSPENGNRQQTESDGGSAQVPRKPI